ncbi:hypothetical protein ACFGVR_14910 [Mucilaginibacter sp. AW1-3]
MANFTKSDLAYTGYKETAYPSDDPHVTGKPDSTLLNKSETYEIVPFINRYMAEHNWKEKSIFLGIEKFLQTSEHKHKSHQFWREELDKNFKLNA